MGAEGEVKVVITGEETVSPAAAKSTEAIGGLNEQLKKAGIVTEETNHHFNASRLLMTELNKIVPGLGHALHAAFAGPIAPIIGAAIVIAEVTAKIKEYNKELDEAGAKAGEADFIGNIESKLEVLRTAAEAAQSYSDKLTEIATGEENISTKLKEQLGLDKAIEVARAELESAQKGLAIAKIQQAEAAGQITPEKAAEARAGVEKKFIEQQEADKEAAQAKELQRQQAALAAAQAQAKALHDAEVAAAAAVDKDAAHRAAVALDPAEQQKKIAEATARAGILGDQAAEAERLAEKYSTDSDAAPAFAARARKARGSADAAQGEVNNLQRQLQQYIASLNPAEQAKLKDAEAESKKRETDNVTEIRNLNESIKQLKEIIRETWQPNFTTAETKKATIDAQENTRLSNAFAADARTIHEFDNAKNVSPELVAKAAQAIRDMQSVLQNHKDLLHSIVDLAGIIKELKQAQADMAKRIPPAN